MRKAIHQMHLRGMSAHEIAKGLRVSSNTVRSVIKAGGTMPDRTRSDKRHIDADKLRALYKDCDGIIQRVHEKLREEEGIEIGYSTLTDMLRRMGISKPAPSRCDSKPDVPGAEMQHDTSPYTLDLGGKQTPVIASLLYLRYSKRRYLKFYRRFNRFLMKCFFHEALLFWGYSAAQCVIDNTNLARLRGTGKNALIVPEMKVFSKRYGFEFLCHEKGHSNRKAGEERSFRTVETNFFPGRTFTGWNDLNAQALDWATVRMEHRPQTKARVIPAKAFEHEQGYLRKLPSYLPEPYDPHERVTDQYGYAAFDGNFYWVPGTKRFTVQVFAYANRLKIYHKRSCLAEYPLPPEGTKNERISPAGMPPSPYAPKNRKRPSLEEDRRLRDMAPSVGAYLDFCFEAKGLRRHQFTRELFAVSRRMSAELFVRAVERALRYRVRDIATIERIAILYAYEGTANPAAAAAVDWDEHFREREAYREGSLGETPDLSEYDKLLGEADEPASEDEDTETSPNKEPWHG